MDFDFCYCHHGYCVKIFKYKQVEGIKIINSFKEFLLKNVIIKKFTFFLQN